MRAVLQRVKEASVTIEGQVVGAIGQGYLILLGVGPQDTEAQVEALWNKIYKLRIFEDGAGKTNLSLRDVGGDVLVVSQFTLFGYQGQRFGGEQLHPRRRLPQGQPPLVHPGSSTSGGEETLRGLHPQGPG